MRKRVEQAWRLRWGSLLSCSAARAVAMSLLDFPGSRGADGNCPLPHDVEQDFRRRSGLVVSWCESVSWCALFLGVMDLFVSRFVHLRDLYTHSMFLISSLKTPLEVNLARFICMCFSRSSGNKASRELMRMS